MKIRGHKVIFGKRRTRIKIWGTDCYESSIKEQEWNIPILNLGGWVEIEFEEHPRTLTEIQIFIEREIFSELDRRGKRKYGIAC